MAEVTLSIGGKAYRLACRDGEEADLRSAGALLETRVSALMETHGAVGEPRLLLMAALLLSGELLEGNPSVGAAPVQPVQVPLSQLEALATRAEALADRLEQAGAGK